MRKIASVFASSALTAYLVNPGEVLAAGNDYCDKTKSSFVESIANVVKAYPNDFVLDRSEFSQGMVLFYRGQIGMIASDSKYIAALGEMSDEWYELYLTRHFDSRFVSASGCLKPAYITSRRGGDMYNKILNDEGLREDEVALFEVMYTRLLLMLVVQSEVKKVGGEKLVYLSPTTSKDISSRNIAANDFFEFAKSYRKIHPEAQLLIDNAKIQYAKIQLTHMGSQAQTYPDLADKREFVKPQISHALSLVRDALPVLEQRLAEVQEMHAAGDPKTQERLTYYLTQSSRFISNVGYGLFHVTEDAYIEYYQQWVNVVHPLLDYMDGMIELQEQYMKTDNDRRNNLMLKGDYINIASHAFLMEQATGGAREAAGKYIEHKNAYVSYVRQHLNDKDYKGDLPLIPIATDDLYEKYLPKSLSRVSYFETKAQDLIQSTSLTEKAIFGAKRKDWVAVEAALVFAQGSTPGVQEYVQKKLAEPVEDMLGISANASSTKVTPFKKFAGGPDHYRIEVTYDIASHNAWGGDMPISGTMNLRAAHVLGAGAPMDEITFNLQPGEKLRNTTRTYTFETPFRHIADIFEKQRMEMDVKKVWVGDA